METGRVFSAARFSGRAFVDKSFLSRYGSESLKQVTQALKTQSETIKAWPDEVELTIKASGEPGNAWENGNLKPYAQIVIPAPNGSPNGSTKHSFDQRDAELVYSSGKSFGQATREVVNYSKKLVAALATPGKVSIAPSLTRRFTIPAILKLAETARQYEPKLSDTVKVEFLGDGERGDYLSSGNLHVKARVSLQNGENKPLVFDNFPTWTSSSGQKISTYVKQVMETAMDLSQQDGDAIQVV